MKRGIIAAVVLGAMLAATGARADVIWKNYKEQTVKLAKASNPAAQLALDNYIFGVTSVLEAANGELELRGVTPLYCKPPNLSLNLDNVKAMLAAEGMRSIQVANELSALSTSIVILHVLKETFPCK